MSKRLALSGLVFVLTLGLVAGFLADFSASEVPEALAAVCKSANSLCNYGMDTTKTATLEVQHKTTNTTPVEPDDGETWTIVAYWNTAGFSNCKERYETASVDVDWNGSGWSLSNKSTTSNILDMIVCDSDDECWTGSTYHDYKYQLAVDITDDVTESGDDYNLRQVVFTSSDMDDGYELDTSACTLGSAVSPNADSFSQTDSGPFECDFACQGSAPIVTIIYQ